MKNPPLILVADDDKDFKEILSAKLLAAGYQLSEASDGQEAITKAKSLIPDLIIMDIQMPNVNGTEAVLDLKHNAATKDIKIAFFTNLLYPWPGVKKENDMMAQELGAVHFMKKSDELSDILKKVKEILGA